MKKGKNGLLVLILVILLLACCFAAVCYFYPEMIGLEKRGGETDVTDIVSGESIEEISVAASSAMENETSEAIKETVEASSEAQTESSEASTASSEASEASSEASKASSEASKASSEASKASSEASKASSEASTASSEASKASSEASSSAGNQADLAQDKSAPVFLYFQSSPQVKIGSTFDVHKYVGYADDLDRDVDLEVSGTVDTSKEGTYSLKLTLTDDAGKKTSKNMDVKVAASFPGGSGSSKKEEFSDFISKYKTEETSVGIDVSRWQETIDFDKLKAAGCEFVYMRLGGYDNGEHYTDRYFPANLAGAKAAGMKIGIYWHSEDCNAEEIKASVEYLTGVLNGEKLDFPVAFDWEDYKNFEQYGMNLQDLNNLFVYFQNELEARGYTACLYGSKNALLTIWTLPRKGPSWLAHYTSATNYEGDYFMWQHSCTGRVDGINGDVDLDILYHGRLSE